MWPMMIASLAGAGLGMMNAQEQRAQKKDELLANAEAIRMSPWTGQKTSIQGYGGTPTATGGAMQGGLTGAMMGSQFGKASAAAPAATPQASAAPGMMAGEAGNPWMQMQQRHPSFYTA